MNANSNNRKSNGIKIYRRLFLMLWLPFFLIEIMLIVFAGLAYFLIVFWLFHMVITGIRFFPQIAYILINKKSDINNEKFINIKAPKSYIVYWIISNTVFLSLAVFSFNYNIRLLDAVFHLTHG